MRRDNCSVCGIYLSVKGLGGGEDHVSTCKNWIVFGVKFILVLMMESRNSTCEFSIASLVDCLEILEYILLVQL